MNKNDKRPFLLIGTFRNEKIRNEIQLSGREIVSKNLTSSPKNWDEIISLLKTEDSFSCVVLSLSESVLLIAQCEQYMERFSLILRLLENLPHIVFLYEDNLFGRFNIFNTRYYIKYLFYDTFFEHRETFYYLENEYYERSKELRACIIQDYLFDTVLPAAFLAEENEWKTIWNRNVKFAMKYDVEWHQMSFFDAENAVERVDYENLPLDAEQFVSFLRETMFFTAAERFEFELLNGPEKMRFIQNKYAKIREDYECEMERREGIVDKIESYILSDNFAEQLTLEEQRSEREYKSFRIYLQERRFNEDEAISSAIDRMGRLIFEMHETGLQVHAYRYSNDIVRVIRDYIENKESGVVFRSYILKDQIYANEVEKLLSLLQEYILRVKKVDISFDQRKTDIGTVYVIRSNDKEILQENFLSYTTEFDVFFNQCCNSNLDILRESLLKMRIDDENTEFFVTKFSKDAKRIRLDLRQEYESKMLKLRHAIESDALDRKEELQLYEGVSTLVEPSVTNALIPSCSIVTAPNSYTQIIFGNPNYNNNDTKLLEYIYELSENKSELEKELQILKDGNSGKSERVGALNKLKKFLADHASDIGSLAFKGLKAYLDTML